MTSNPPDGRVPAASAAGVCKGPGCGNALPAQDRGRARQFCSTECARRYHNDARVLAPAGPAAGSPADPLAELGAVIRQAAVLARAARDRAASLDPALVRAQLAEAEADRHHAEAATVTAQAPHPARRRNPRPRRSRAADPPQGRRTARREDVRVLAGDGFSHPATRPARPGHPGMGHPRGESLYRRSSGTGKSHFAEALAHKAIDAGMRVAWFILESLTAVIGRAAVDGTTAKAITKITRCDLITVDDIGVLPAGQAAAEALHQLAVAAYERRSLIVTSNLHLSGLDTIMPKTIHRGVTTGLPGGQCNHALEAANGAHRHDRTRRISCVVRIATGHDP